MRLKATTAVITLFLSLLSLVPASADGGKGRDGFAPHAQVEIEAEFYAGRRGYLHGGIGVAAPLNSTQSIGVTGHFVREDAEGKIVPSIGAEFVQELDAGVELKAFSFGYLPVERQNAWAVALRGSRSYAMGDQLTVTPFFGPTYARVRAIDEATDTPRSIDHLMLFGGVTLEAGPVAVAVFASHSFFSRDPAGLESHVDLEEMTHFVVYKNNDGFARNTVGVEASYNVTDLLSLAGGYALILSADQTRHSFAITPSLTLSAQLEVFAGLQLLRGDGADNDLVMAGVAFPY